jgi:hypothetical protein
MFEKTLKMNTVNKLMPWQILGLVVFTVFGPAVSTRAELVFTTLGNPQFDNAGVDSGTMWAGRFITSATPTGWNVSAASISIMDVRNAGGNFMLSIYDTAESGRPGSRIDSFLGPSNPTAGINSYSSSGIFLSPLTSYWLVASVSSGEGIYDWALANRTDGSTGGIWISPASNTYASSSNDSTWSLLGDGYPFLFAIEATAAPVPEPSTYAMALAGLACGGYTIFRRRKRA